MIARLLRALVGIGLALAATPVLAADDPDFRAIKAGEPITLRADRAYVLLRLDTDLSKFDALILRVPEPEELAAYDAAKRKAYDAALAKAQAKVTKNPGDKSVERLGSYDAFLFFYEGRSNLFSLRPGKSLITINKIAYVLAEVTPGDYVVYGEGYSGYIYQCFCLGTVGFTAKAGEVTDLGTMLFAKAWEPSPIPELVGEVDLGRSAVMDYGLFAVALRAARTGETAPPGLDPAAIHPAAFRAVGAFVDTNVVQINRLAAMPGVLAYQDGKVIDVPSGKELAPH
jgi:hypothetical protein